MTLLFPLGLLGLASLPVLVWLWRLYATRRQTHVPSLIPFEHLLQRSQRRRTRLVVNTRFWLQLAALIGMALALAQPAVRHRRARLIFAVLDTSASMEASLHGTSRFEHARQALLARLARMGPATHVFIMTTAPVRALSQVPTADVAALAATVRGVRPSDVGGTLDTAVRIGRALLKAAPDELWVFTDEPMPSEPLPKTVQWTTVGAPVPNVAIVGLDTQGAFCNPAVAHAIVTVQNFSDETSVVQLFAIQHGRRLADTSTELSPRAQQALSLALPDGTTGWVELSVRTAHDALEVDNHARISVGPNALLPIVVRSDNAAFLRTLSGWLGACRALTWTADTPPPESAFVLVTDREDTLMSSARAALLFLPPAQPRPIHAEWVTVADHPIAFYLSPVQRVTAALNLEVGEGMSGVPVVSGLVDGRKVPIVMAGERAGRRVVSILLDPSHSEEATALLLSVFNGLRWLMGSVESLPTGEPLLLDGFHRGPITVHRPDGLLDTMNAVSATLRYEATDVAGTYRVTQGAIERTTGVNFLDPIESNTLTPVSTWHTSTERAPTDIRHPSSGTFPVTLWVVLIVLAVLCVEWWLSSMTPAP